jgi:hypothetical protein
MGILINGKPAKKPIDIIERLLTVFYTLYKEGKLDGSSLDVSQLIAESDVDFGSTDPSKFLEWMMERDWIRVMSSRPRRHLKVNLWDQIELRPKGIEQAQVLLDSPNRRHLRELCKELYGITMESFARGVSHR